MDALYAQLKPAQAPVSVGVLVLLLAVETARPFFPPVSTRKRARHAFVNLGVGLFNSLAISLAFAGLWLGAAVQSELWGLGLLHWHPMPDWTRTLCAVLVLDGWAYAWHRWNHRSVFLWRYHRTHHSDEEMDVTTAGRFHLGELVLSSVLRVPVILAAGVRLPELALYDLAMFSVVQFQHANVGLPSKVERALSWLLVTPGMHKVHHSRIPAETNSNYSSLFSFWDRVFSSFRYRADPGRIQFGLDEFEGPGLQGLAGLWRTPGVEPGGNRTAWGWVVWIPPVLIVFWVASRAARWWLG